MHRWILGYLRFGYGQKGSWAEISGIVMLMILVWASWFWRSRQHQGNTVVSLKLAFRRWMFNPQWTVLIYLSPCWSVNVDCEGHSLSGCARGHFSESNRLVTWFCAKAWWSILAVLLAVHHPSLLHIQWSGLCLFKAGFEPVGTTNKLSNVMFVWATVSNHPLTIYNCALKFWCPIKFISCAVRKKSSWQCPNMLISCNFEIAREVSRTWVLKSDCLHLASMVQRLTVLSRFELIRVLLSNFFVIRRLKRPVAYAGGDRNKSSFFEVAKREKRGWDFIIQVEPYTIQSSAPNTQRYRCWCVLNPKLHWSTGLSPTGGLPPGISQPVMFK